MAAHKPMPQLPNTSATHDHLQQTALQCRHAIIDILTAVQSSHLGCSYSIVDILVVLYHCFLDVKLIKQQDPCRDYFILSKGHAVSALYATLASVNLIAAEEFKNYHQGYLAGHPCRTLDKGIEASTGSLGQGLSLGVGLAIAALHDQRPSRVYVLVGDGECQEGAIWEAVTMASRFKLNNLTIIVDNNNLQGLGRPSEIAPGSLTEKFTAFGCHVTEVDGHHYEELINTINQCGIHDKPDVIIAQTIKGKGLTCIQDRLEWHYRSLKTEQYKEAKKELYAS